MENKNKQEKNVGAFSENAKKTENKSSKIKLIISRIILFIMPLVLLPASIAVLLVVGPLLPNDWGSIYIGVIIILCVFSIHGYIYGLFVAQSEKRKKIFALYNPAVSTIVFYMTKIFDRYLSYYVAMFAVIAFWTLVPIWRYNYNHNSENNEEASSKDEPGKIAKKLLYLFSIFFISIFLRNLIFSDSIDSLIAYAILVTLFFVLFPLASFFYSKAFLKNNRDKWLKSVICPAVLALSYLILYFRVDKTYIIALILFVWCEIWSLIGMKGSQKNKNK